MYDILLVIFYLFRFHEQFIARFTARNIEIYIFFYMQLQTVTFQCTLLVFCQIQRSRRAPFLSEDDYNSAILYEFEFSA